MKVKIRPILLAICLASTWAISACSNGQEQNLAQALLQEMHFINDQPQVNHNKAYASDLAKFSDEQDQKVVHDLYESMARISQTEKLIETLEAQLQKRYPPGSAEIVVLEAIDGKVLDQIKQAADALMQDMTAKGLESEKGWILSNFRIPNGLKTEANWKEVYVQHKPAYAVFLYAATFKNSLHYVRKQFVGKFSSYMYPYSGFYAIKPEYRILSDRLPTGNAMKAAIFLRQQGGLFPKSLYSNFYPKGFYLNGKEFPIEPIRNNYDLKTFQNNYKVDIAIATTPSELMGKESVVKQWTGKWIMPTSDTEDTAISISGTYMLQAAHE